MTKTTDEHARETTTISRIPITHKQIEAVKTERGGWTKQQLSEWGVPWPPPKGWKEKIATFGYPYEP